MQEKVGGVMPAELLNSSNSIGSVVNQCAARGDLLKEVELVAVGGKDGQAGLGSRQEDERIIEAIPPAENAKHFPAQDRGIGHRRVEQPTQLLSRQMPTPGGGARPPL